MANLKAYLVDAGNDETGESLHFAATAGQAKAQAANYEDINFIEVASCKRMPALDQYAPGPVPAKVLFDMGWWFECWVCNTRVSSDAEGWEDDEPYPMEPVFEGQAVYCSARCKARHEQRESDCKAHLAKIKEEATAAVLTKWPAARVKHVWESHDGKVNVSFEVDGLSDSVRWEVGGKDVLVTFRDKEKWISYQDRIIAARGGRQ